MSGPQVRAGQQWKHRKGRIYTVLCVANDKATKGTEFPLTVVYIDSSSNVWSRLYPDFLDKFERVEDPYDTFGGTVAMLSKNMSEPPKD